MAIKAAAYIRVSTEYQKENSPEAQLKAIKAYAQSHDMIIPPENIFQDLGASGKSTKHRPEFNRMINIAKEYKKSSDRPFNVILVHKTDRFSRNREDSVYFKALLRKTCNVEVISVSEHIDDDKYNTIIEPLVEGLAEFYVKNLSEEVKKGMKIKAARGEYMTVAPYGYRMKEGKLVIDEEEAEHVRYIFNECVSGTPIRKIVNNLNDLGVRTHRGNRFEHRTVKYILENITYKGYTRWNPNKKDNYRVSNDDDNRIIVKGVHPSIIEEDLFDQVQELLAISRRTSIKRSQSQERHVHWLSGLVKCSNCGSSLTYSKSSKSFQCLGYSHGVCKVSHYISEETLQKIVIDELRYILDLNDVDSYIIHKKPAKNDNSELKNIDKQIAKINSRLSELLDVRLDGGINNEEYKKKKKSEEDKIAVLKRRQEELNAKEFQPEDFKIHASNALDALLLPNFTNEEKSIALKSIISKIVFDKRNGKFIFYYLY